MQNESLKIMVRRSSSRLLETALLVLAVSLGVGAASAGFSLLADTLRSSRQMLASPGYREIVVSTQSNADEMDNPVSLKAVSENAVLTSADLNAAELAPDVTYGYVKNPARMRFINEESLARDEERRQEMALRSPPDMPDPGAENPGDQTAPQGGSPPPGRPDEPVNLEEYAGDESILLADIEDASGFEVTNGFFNAWQLKPLYGSLFSQDEFSGTSSVTVLGYDLARLLLPEGASLSSLPGKKLLTREGLVTIVGVLDKGDEENSMAFFSPYQADGGRQSFRRMFMNTQLRFTVDDPALLDETAGQLRSWFDSRYGKQQIVLSNPRAEALQLVKRNTGLGMLILFLAMASLFIASVNVSNMLMSRSVRMKKHVGILMALGASRKDIFLLFAREAGGIVLAGAFLGALLSIPLEQYMSRALEVSGHSWLFTLSGVLLSAVLTLLFGLLPSRQYSRIDPALAMRAA